MVGQVKHSQESSKEHSDTSHKYCTKANMDKYVFYECFSCSVILFRFNETLGKHWGEK